MHFFAQWLCLSWIVSWEYNGFYVLSVIATIVALIRTNKQFLSLKKSKQTKPLLDLAKIKGPINIQAKNDIAAFKMFNKQVF